MKRMERRSHAHAMDGIACLEDLPWPSHLSATNSGNASEPALASTQASSLPVPRGASPWITARSSPASVFVLKTGIRLGGVAPGDGLWLWHDLPRTTSMPGSGPGSGKSCTRSSWPSSSRPTSSIGPAPRIDSAKAQALGGGDQTGPNPTDRGKPGTKHHVLTEGQGVPLVTHSTGANVPDVNELLPLVDDIPPVRRKADRPRRVPDNLYADRAYDSQPHRQELECAEIDPHLARRRTEHGSGLGVYSLGGGADLVVAAQLSQAPVADRSRGSGP